MASYNCQQCGIEFRAKPSRNQKYCSQKCNGISKETSTMTPCEVCGRLVSMDPSHRRKGRGRFCSPECCYKVKQGSGSHKWKGGIRKTSQGYIVQISNGHPRAFKKDNCVFQHVLIAEGFIGRFLKTGETIHHINEIKNDNRPENFYLFKSRGEHTRYHMLFKHGKVDRITMSNLDSFKTVI